MHSENTSSSSNRSNTMLAHMVYFSLKEPTPENREKMLAACHKYLTDHPGQVFYAAGTCASYDRPVNDRGFDIALQTVFVDRAAHDAYQVAPRHKQFISEWSPMWAKVRVFDADVRSA
jgi:Stress responsive A/B Barrel Domain